MRSPEAPVCICLAVALLLPLFFLPVQESLGVFPLPDYFHWSPKNPVVLPGTNGSWDDGEVLVGSVIQDNGTFMLYYSGAHNGTRKIGLATSGDGENWTKYASNPILTPGSPGQWDELGTLNAFVLKDNLTYKMWYTGCNSSTRSIGYATSSDGKTWTKHASNPVLTNGTAGSWEGSGLNASCVLKENGTYRMWYAAFNASGQKFGYANSTDGANWTKYASNPLKTEYAIDWGEPHSVINDSGTFRMYIDYYVTLSKYYNLDMLSSADGLSWNSDDMDWHWSDPGRWITYDKFSPSVIWNGTSYIMCYAGRNATIYGLCYAEGYNTPLSIYLTEPNNCSDGRYFASSCPTYKWDGTYYSLHGYERAYQVQVSNVSDLGTVWLDTGRQNLVNTMHTFNATYQEDVWYYWLVRMWDGYGDHNESQIGCFRLDWTPPTAPTCLTSTSHLIGEWSNDSTMDFYFNGSLDNLSGLNGTSYSISTCATTVPDTNKELGPNGTTVIGLSAPSNSTVYFHLRVFDKAGNSATFHLGPFKVDATAPVNPTVSSSTHTSGTWSNRTTVNTTWSGAGDATSGVYGYSVLWDQSSSTVPDTVVDLVGAGNNSTSQQLGEGSWYFHVRTRDNAGNWAVTHFGPVRIDTGAPVNPTALNSTSHGISNWSNDTTVDIQLSGATDSLSGVDGYSTAWDNSSVTVPDTVKEVGFVTSFTGPSLWDGSSVYLHVRAVDRAGNGASGAIHLGPFFIDGSPPIVPPINSSTHNTSKWSNVTVVNVSWDDVNGSLSGISGFSVVWDGQNDTVPDREDELPAGARNTTRQEGDGTWYFHLRTADRAGNWAVTHFGPVLIDTQPPGNPIQLRSSSHRVGNWSNDRTVDLMWSGGGGGPSGVLGYSVVWDNAPDTIPDEMLEYGGSITAITGPELLDGGDHYFHIRVRDGAGNWNSTAVHLGPFCIDTTPPQNPENLTSSSHQPGTWSAIPVVVVNWTLPYDGGALSGYDGFAFLWTTSPSTVPDGTLAVNGSATGVSSPVLADSQGIFCHIRARDRAGNWAAGAVHIGPFRLDSTPPSNPAVVNSPSHRPSVWSNDSTVDIIWSGAYGEISGLGGYSLLWDTGSRSLPPQTVNAPVGSANATSPRLSDGMRWYFHIRTRDLSGNWAQNAVHLGPFYIDTIPPKVVDFRLDNGAPCTNNVNISINFKAEDVGGAGIGMMRFCVDGISWTQWEKYTDSERLVLGGGDGQWTVHAQVADCLWNINSPVQASILLDTTAPTVAEMLLNGGAGLTSSIIVSLKLTASDPHPSSGLDKMSFGSEGGQWSDWEPFAGTRDMVLAPGDGPKKVLVRLRDLAGNVGAASMGRIFVDTMPPEVLEVRLAGGAGHSTSVIVPLAIRARDLQPSSGIDMMSLSEDGVNWGDWSTYEANTTLSLGGDGVHSVYVKVRDKAMNAAQPVSGAVLIETTSPNVSSARVLHAGRHNVSLEIVLNEPGSVELLYGHKGLDIRASPGSVGTRHVLEIGNLSEGTTYIYRVIATDIYGNNRTDGADRQFMTSPAPSARGFLGTTDGAVMAVGTIAAALLAISRRRDMSRRS